MPAWNSQREQIGELSCTVIRPESDAQLNQLCVLCHGFGAPGSDLVPLAHELVSVQPQLGATTEFIFPEAPLSLAEYGYADGRAWWMIDMQRLQMAMQTNQIRDLRTDRPDRLDASREALDQVIQQSLAQHGWGLDRLIVGGFSQGSMVATDWVLRQSTAVKLLCVMSGTLLNETEWQELLNSAAPATVLQSHGTQDPILPFEAAEWLRELLERHGFDVDFRPFDGPHTISGEVLMELAQRLAAD